MTTTCPSCGGEMKVDRSNPLSILARRLPRLKCIECGRVGGLLDLARSIFQAQPMPRAPTLAYDPLATDECGVSKLRRDCKVVPEHDHPLTRKWVDTHVSEMLDGIKTSTAENVRTYFDRDTFELRLVLSTGKDIGAEYVDDLYAFLGEEELRQVLAGKMTADEVDEMMAWRRDRR